MLTVQECEKLWDEFLETWPVSRIETMTLQEYSSVGDQDSFCYWIESRLGELGSIWGGNAFKFGVFNRRDKTEKERSRGRDYDSNYGWDTRFGNDSGSAFHSVKKYILEIIESVTNSEIEKIELIPLWPVFKWKIAFLYQNRDLPLLIGAYKTINLVEYLNNQKYSLKTPQSELYKAIMEKRGEEPILEFSRKVWDESEERLNNKLFLVDEAESILSERYEPIGDGTKKCIGYRNDAGLTICLLRGEGKNTVVLVMELWEPNIEGIKIKTHYGKDDTRNSNFASQAPKVAYGNEAIVIECSNRQLFESLLDAYENLQKNQSKDGAHGDNHMNQPLNRILYGPPGTGKTYSTVKHAIKILGVEDAEITSIQKLKEKFPKQVEFITFHQSFSYEDFVEGLKADNDDKGHLVYSVVPGIFKQICENARDAGSDSLESFNAELEKLKREVAEEPKTLTTSTGKSFDFTYQEGMKTFRVIPNSSGKKFGTEGAESGYPVSLNGIKELYKNPEHDLYNISYARAILKHLNLDEYEESVSNKPHILIIDEINRGNISRIFGELITLIEESKRAGNDEEISVILPYSKDELPFSVPKNLYIIGTMNTADRSLTQMDTALRRRFDFFEMMPEPELLKGKYVEGIDLVEMLTQINKRIEVLYDREHTIGHAFLMNVTGLDELCDAFNKKVLPLLEEYFFDDWEKIMLVLADRKQNFYEVIEAKDDLFFGMDVNHEVDVHYRRRLGTFSKEAFSSIYKPGN